MKKLIALFALVLVLTSCATKFKGSKMVNVSPGIPKEEVLQTLGKPQSVSGSGKIEVLHYAEDQGWYRFTYYYVRLVDGKVESYGIETKKQRVTESEPPLKTLK